LLVVLFRQGDVLHTALLTLAYRFEETGCKAYLPWLESWAEWAMYEMPRTST
jgi:rhamnogalacturonyl hydrolase YesR